MSVHYNYRPTDVRKCSQGVFDFYQDRTRQCRRPSKIDGLCQRHHDKKVEDEKPVYGYQTISPY